MRGWTLGDFIGDLERRGWTYPAFIERVELEHAREVAAFARFDYPAAREHSQVFHGLLAIAMLWAKAIADRSSAHG